MRVTEEVRSVRVRTWMSASVMGARIVLTFVQSLRVHLVVLVLGVHPRHIRELLQRGERRLAHADLFRPKTCA